MKYLEKITNDHDKEIEELNKAKKKEDMDQLDLLQLRNQIFENLKKGFEELEF